MAKNKVSEKIKKVSKSVVPDPVAEKPMQEIISEAEAVDREGKRVIWKEGNT